MKHISCGMSMQPWRLLAANIPFEDYDVNAKGRGLAVPDLFEATA